MIVSWYGVRGAWSEPQSKNGLITTLVMVWPSESTIGGGATRGGVRGVQVVEQRLTEVELAIEGLAVRIEQQLARVAPLPGGRVPRAVDAEAVALSGATVGR